MSKKANSAWLRLSPSLGDDPAAESAYREYAKHLSKQAREMGPALLQDMLDEALEQSKSASHSSVLRAALCVVTDLARQRWFIRVTEGGAVEVQRPLEDQFDPRQEKHRIRQQELVKRDEQLAEPAVRKFVEGMEKTVLHKGRPVSVYSLFRDGRELANTLRGIGALSEADQAVEFRKAIDPYLQFVDDGTTCEHTGLRLGDIWRYFRHTWSNQYTSKPGRWTAILVRDRAREYHPIVGIASIASPIVQIRERDIWIGWDGNTFLKNATENPTEELGHWLYGVVNGAISEIWIQDFLEEEIIDQSEIRNPTPDTIRRLKWHGESQRNLHRRFARSREMKSGARVRGVEAETNRWKERAKSHLYRSKRAISLASMLEARAFLNQATGGHATAASVQAILKTAKGRAIVKRILRKAKADRVGIAVADIAVCGAVEPYSQILGGKLVSMLAASPQVLAFYRSKYENQESEIASSMAGRGVVRSSQLVLLGTTSLYGVGSSQYNRLRMPAESLGGKVGEYLEYRRIGKSEAYGTSHFSEETVKALVTLVQQSNTGMRVNSLFGEGVSPKFRKIREGLELLHFPCDDLLQHGRRRIVYGIPLIRNLRQFLIGQDHEPDYLFDLTRPQRGTDAIVEWWTKRWLSKRIMSEEIIARLEEHTLVRPVRHGARVTLPKNEDGQEYLFEDFSQ